MPSTYQFDEAFNRERIFACTPPPKIDLSTLPNLPSDWLTQLELECRKYVRELIEHPFEKHITASYPELIREELFEHLKLIYHRLLGNLDAKLGCLPDTARVWVVSTLVEDIKECTYGLYNRANLIAGCLRQPESFQQLLYVVRNNLVIAVAEAEAKKPVAQGIHLLNRVTVIAFKDGLGIQPNLENDPYTAGSDRLLRTALQKKFEKKYTPFNLPFLLEKELKKNLESMEYKGLKEKGDSYEDLEIEIFKKLIENCLPEQYHFSNFRDYFYIDDDDCVRDIDWHSLRRRFFEVLMKEGYFIKDPQPQNLIDWARYSNLCSENNDCAGQEATYISDLLEKKDYSSLLKQLEKIQSTFPEYYEKLIELIKNKNLIQNVPELLSFLNQKIKCMSADSLEILQVFKLLTTIDPNIIEEHRESLRQIFIQSNREGFNALTLASAYRPELVEPILALMTQCREIDNIETLKQTFATQENKDKCTALMIASLYQPKAVITILKYLNTIGHDENFAEIIKLLLTQTDATGRNVLMVALSSRSSETTRMILSFLKDHREVLGTENLKKIFLQIDTIRWNALMRAAVNQPKSVSSILTFIEDEIADVEIVKQILMQTSLAGGSVLMLAANAALDTGTIKTIFNFIIKNNEILDGPEIIKSMLMQKTRGSPWNLLMTVARYQPENTAYLINFVAGYFNSPQKFEILTEMLTHTSTEGVNALMLAAYSHPKAVSDILSFLSEQKEILGIETLMKIITQSNEDGENALIMAMRNQPEASIAIMEFIVQHDEIPTTEIIQNSLIPYLRKHINNPMHHPSGIAQGFRLLTMMDSDLLHNPQILQSVKTTLEQQTVIEPNALIWTAHYQPEAAIAILEFMDKHCEKLGNEIIERTLIETNSSGMNTLMKAVYFHPKVACAILTFMEKQKGIFNPHILEQILVQKGNCTHLNSLMYAIYFGQLKLIEPIVSFMFKLLPPKSLKLIFTQKDKNGMNFLQIATTAQCRSEELTKTVLESMAQHTNLLDDELIDVIFSDDTLSAVLSKENAHLLLNFFFTNEHKVSARNQEKLVNLMLIQLNRLDIEDDEQRAFADKILSGNSYLLLKHFSADYFNADYRKLRYITKQLLKGYQNATITRLNSFTLFGYSPKEKIAAANALGISLSNPSALCATEESLKSRHPAVTDGRLGKLFAAYQMIANNRAISPQQPDAHPPVATV